jgi:hypothetical protein
MERARNMHGWWRRLYAKWYKSPHYKVRAVWVDRLCRLYCWLYGHDPYTYSDTTGFHDGWQMCSCRRCHKDLPWPEGV